MKLPFPPAPPFDTPHSLITVPLGPIQTALERQQLRSERVRVTAFIVLLAFLLLVLGLLRTRPGLMAESVRQQLVPSFVPLSQVLGLFLLYEAAVGWWLTRLWQSHRRPPAWFP